MPSPSGLASHFSAFQTCLNPYAWPFFPHINPHANRCHDEAVISVIHFTFTFTHDVMPDRCMSVYVGQLSLHHLCGCVLCDWAFVCSHAQLKHTCVRFRCLWTSSWVVGEIHKWCSSLASSSSSVQVSSCKTWGQKGNPDSCYYDCYYIILIWNLNKWIQSPTVYWLLTNRLECYLWLSVDIKTP